MDQLDQGWILLREERRRQTEVEGWTFEHDDHHSGGQMYAAAMCYLRAKGPSDLVSNLWPWEREWWKPKDRRLNLIRTGALLLAEQERISRRKTGTGGSWPPTVEIPFLLDGIALELGQMDA